MRERRAIQDIRVAAGVEGDRDGLGRIVGPGAGEPHDDAGRAVGVEQLEAPVDRVGHRADAAGVGRDAHRRVELADRPPRGAERALQRAAAVEDVDAVVAGVRDVDLALRVDRDRRADRPAGPGAVPYEPQRPLYG